MTTKDEYLANNPGSMLHRVRNGDERKPCWTCLHDAEHQTDGGYGHCNCECHEEGKS